MMRAGAPPRATALVLAAQRGGTVDPLAAAAGVSHKCLVPVAGRPLIAHVADALAASPQIGPIRISIDAPHLLDGVPEVVRLVRSGRATILTSRLNLVDSVLTAAADAVFPLIVTTADNVLLDPAAIEAFEQAAAGSDVAVAFTARESVLAAHADGQRRFYRFRCGAYSNCNLYRIAGREALAAAEMFRGGGQFAKHPRRIVQAFGLMNLLRFRLGTDSLATSFARFSRRLGLAIAPVVLDDGRLAIDVDNARTRDIAEDLLHAQRIDAIAAE